ncbi:MAG: aminomethyl-transferring glycine dehydrogenase subunit GcvPA [Methylococcales bacterium]|jgi:glycine dehydrogenase subunit 1|nr:aminomethyl-transferring glycine dehydrogenase subunit GcvPA [Methylococcales bacterium]MBT7409121.1 aminomethyl-transferring glycine dehydrogenase subunit GcvPA [Methylococcales bacterium]
MPYIPHTEQDLQDMLETIGVDSLENLFDEVPDELKCQQVDSIPLGLSELDVVNHMKAKATVDDNALNFIGAGAYEHHIPAAVWEITFRGEFYTAYTPYQAEASQGTLQLLYEFQSMMVALTNMDVSNASLYDGASALAEAVLMSIRSNRKSKSRRILISKSSHPRYRDVTNTLVKNQGIQLTEIDFLNESGSIDFTCLEKYQSQDFAALVIQQPNFFGSLEDVDKLTNWAHENKMLVIAATNPISLAMLKPPGSWGETGADIVCGEGQPLGIPLSSGGPYFGFLCCKSAYMRQMPGRIVGKTVDLDGETGYTLTLQAREQHIRRSKATSNICTNQGLMVTAATIHLSIMGMKGLKNVAYRCHQNAIKLRDKLIQLPGVNIVYDVNFFHEFVLQFDLQFESIIRALEAQNISPGYLLGKDFPEMKNCLLICVTETKTDDELEFYFQTLSRIIERQSSAGCPVKPKM